MTDPRAALMAAMAALEQQRGLIGDATTDTALQALRQQLEALPDIAAQAAGQPTAQTLADPPAVGPAAAPAAALVATPATTSAALPAPPPAPPEAPAPGEQQFRQVSVLFLDMVGSTRLVGKLDPEQVQQVLDGALTALTEVVQQHGGEVLQYAGDNLLAAFGAAGAREDDAERAVRCGLALLAEGLRQGEAVQREHGHEGFGVRVGIHTGTVLRGGGVDGDKTLRGQAVHIAARMEQSAPPGGLRISHDTYGLVRGLFDAQAQEPISVKGVEQPMRSWLVERMKARHLRLHQRGIEGLETPLVGRDTELARLLEACHALRQDAQARCFTIVAEPGLGKSRLMHELQHQLARHDSGFWLLRARQQPDGLLQPYGLLRELLAWRLGIADSDNAETARGKLVEWLAPWLTQPGDPPAAALGQLIGLDFGEEVLRAGLLNDARLLRDRGLAVVATWLRRLSESDGSPVVLLLDDVQWADDASLDALRTLLAGSTFPLMAVMGARPALLERRPDWGADLPNHERITLPSLDAAGRRRLTQVLLHRMADVPAALAELIDHQAEGNPFYAEEIIRMLLDDGVIVAGVEGWHCDAVQLASARVPATLTGVLQARIDGLATAERRALQTASIVGPVFWDQALSHLRADAAMQLPGLQRRGMVEPRLTSAFEGSDEAAFHHHLLHQVSYDTVLPSVRREGHARTADWLAERIGDRAGEYLAVTAAHYERAGDHKRAFDWYYRAAVEGNRRYAIRTSIQHAGHALAIVQNHADAVHPQQRYDLHRLRSNNADLLGDREVHGEALQAAMAIAEELGDAKKRAFVLAASALLADRLGDTARAQQLAEQAVPVAEGADEAAQAALAWGELAWLAIGRRDYGSAEPALESAMRWARLASERDDQPESHMYRAQLQLVAAEMHRQRRNHAALRAAQEEAATVARRFGGRRLLVTCEIYLAVTACDAGDFEQATVHGLEAVRLAGEIGVALSEEAARHRLARIALESGDAPSCLEWITSALAIGQRIGSRDAVAKGRALEAEAHALLGQHEQAAAMHEAVAADWLALGNEHEARAARLNAAGQHLALGRGAEALAAVLQELDAIDTEGALESADLGQRARLAAWRVLEHAGHPRAKQVLERVHDELVRQADSWNDAALRERVLTRFVVHREIVAAWVKQAPA